MGARCVDYVEKAAAPAPPTPADVSLPLVVSSSHGGGRTAADAAPFTFSSATTVDIAQFSRNHEEWFQEVGLCGGCVLVLAHVCVFV